MPSRKFFANVRKALSLKPLSLRHQILRSYFRDTTLKRLGLRPTSMWLRLLA